MFALNSMDVLALLLVVGAMLAFGVSLRRQTPAPVNPDAGADAVFLFVGAQLTDATPQAQQLIAPFAHLSDLDAVLHVLTPEFPGLAAAVRAPSLSPRRVPHASDGAAWVDIAWPGGHLRIVVHGDTDRTAVSAAELALLRDVTTRTPQMIWQSGADGKLIWANPAYLAFWDTLNPGAATALADKILFTALPPTCRQKRTIRRAAIPLPRQNAEHWCDVTTIPDGDSALHFADDANTAVRADQDRQNFVQTLGKTFAELSVGLAIFDKRRQLATFNPALLDMMRLDFSFLSTRPTIDTVLDRLRETRMLPEPKNYATWRDQFTAVEAGAKNGTYSEVWNLPDGQAFRVTGRPHPDGAFAFVFDDITADLSLTRRFRSDIETGQAVLDALPDGIAVFSTAGTLVMYNAVYGSMWGNAAPTGIEHRELRSEMALWRMQCTTPEIWNDLRDIIYSLGPRQAWSDDVLTHDGQLIRCHARPIQGGMTMLHFVLAPRGLPAIRKLAQGDPAVRVAKC